MSEFWQLSAAETAQKVKSKQVSAIEVTCSALARLEAVNPSVNAVVKEMPQEALKAAEEVDARIANGEDAGLLAGVPVTVKVNVDQKGHATTNGLVLQKDLIAEHDSPVVSNMRKAGAIIIGRTNTPAFSMRWFTRNLLHGGTTNPTMGRLRQVVLLVVRRLLRLAALGRLVMGLILVGPSGTLPMPAGFMGFGHPWGGCQRLIFLRRTG